MIFKDYYKILGLQNNKVSMAEIKSAYREQAKKYHPDVNIANKKYEERFKDINEAYRVLSDSLSKRKYDRMWNRNVGRKNASYEESKRSKDSLFSDFFTMFFGSVEENKPKMKNKKAPSKGENIETEINISIEDAFRGKEQTIGVRTVEGKLKKFKVAVPAGIQNNEKIRIVGQGKPGVDGGKNGDLFVRVKIKNDERFILDGYNLRTNLYLTPWEAALSTKVTINGINEDVSIYVPAGIQSGEKIEIEDRGYKDGKGGRGKLILDTKIMIPKRPNEKELELFKQFSEMSKFNPRNS
ncbi:MAG: DnaJ domain-containing protein [Clostridia bacterium]|nr:DnaJ domain-containing protein [Clostridia bacterium]